MKYHLMHRNDRAAVLDINNQGYINKMETVDATLLPPCLQCPDADIDQWWAERALPKSRPNLKWLLWKHHIPSTAKLLLDNLALSITDCYWLCPEDASLSWSEVSLFRNAFEGDLSLHLDRRTYPHTPAASTGGELEKRWERRDGKIYLLKGNMPGNSFHQSLNEVFASNLHSMQGFDNHVDYSLVDFGDGVTGCTCECFTSEDVELVPAWQVMKKYKKRNDQNDYAFFLECMEREGISAEDARCFLDYQTMTDFLITNLDRHLNNFGLLRDSRTLDMIGPAPIFDSGNSMLHSGLYKSGPVDLLERKVVSLCNTEGRMIAQVKTLDALDLDRLPSSDEIAAFYKQDPMLTSAASTIAEAFTFKRLVLSAIVTGFSFTDVEDAVREYCQGSEDRPTLSVVNDQLGALGPDGFIKKYYRGSV